MNIIFMNPDKFKRANDIFALFSRTNIKTQGDIDLRDRHLELLTEAKVNVKDKDATVAFIYKMLGGATQTQEEAAKIKAKKEKAKPKRFGRVAKEDDGDSDEKPDEDNDD